VSTPLYHTPIATNSMTRDYLCINTNYDSLDYVYAGRLAANARNLCNAASAAQPVPDSIVWKLLQFSSKTYSKHDHTSVRFLERLGVVSVEVVCSTGTSIQSVMTR
jgi:hypothetical protein